MIFKQFFCFRLTVYPFSRCLSRIYQRFFCKKFRIFSFRNSALLASFYVPISEYMRDGGLPYIAVMNRTPEKVDTYLEGIYNTVIVKDIEDRQARKKPIRIKEKSRIFSCWRPLPNIWPVWPEIRSPSEALPTIWPQTDEKFHLTRWAIMLRLSQNPLSSIRQSVLISWENSFWKRIESCIL